MQDFAVIRKSRNLIFKTIDMTDSQNKQILNALNEGAKLTPLDMLQRFGCFRASARIYDLRRQGHVISSTRVKVGKKWVAQYEKNDLFETIANALKPQ